MMMMAAGFWDDLDEGEFLDDKILKSCSDPLGQRNIPATHNIYKSLANFLGYFAFVCNQVI